VRFLAEQVAKVLRIPAAKIDPRRPLNEIGVDSLMAVELIHQVESQSGIAIPTSQLMSGAPSVQKLAELLHVNIMGGQVESAAPAATVGTAADFVQDASLERSGITFAGGDISPAQIEDPQVIFLTGVHDFLGAHLLAGLLRHTRAEVRCLTSEQEAAAGMRAIQDHLTLHQCWEEAFTDRIRPVPGDIARPLLGLSAEDFATLAAEVDVIHHATAHISHIASYQQLRDINVGGTVEIIRLAATTRRKPVHYLSSISVLMARHPGGTELREDTPLPNHAALTVGYNQSRWVSEQLFLRAREQGIPVNLYRPGLLAGDIRTGIGPADDVFWRFLKTCIHLGAGPRASYNTLLTPVDYVAAAMVRLSLGQHHGGRTYHLINPASPDFGDLLDLTAACGYPVRVVNEEEWEAVLTGSSLSLQDNPIAAYLMFIPRDVLSLLLREKSARFCRNALDDLAGSGITCPPVDRELMQLYLAHFVRSGAFPPPATPPADA
jgi:thioester reductase-like protein